MACILRAWGRLFEVDQCVAKLKLDVTKVYRRGEPLFRTQPRGARQRFSGFNAVVSDGERSQLARQFRDAGRFLSTHSSQVRRLRRWPGVEGIDLDFGVEWKRDTVVQSSRIPEPLVALAGKLGLSLEITMYPYAAPDAPKRSAARTRGRRTRG